MRKAFLKGPSVGGGQIIIWGIVLEIGMRIGIPNLVGVRRGPRPLCFSPCTVRGAGFVRAAQHCRPPPRPVDPDNPNKWTRSTLIIGEEEEGRIKRVGGWGRTNYDLGACFGRGLQDSGSPTLSIPGNFGVPDCFAQLNTAVLLLAQSVRRV